MVSTILAALGFFALGTAAYLNYLFYKTTNLLKRIPYRDAATFAVLLFLASIALKLNGW
ncbi:hypothetical protein KGQ34_00410 [Patescibacteria group bacterium]|nr:hypothetical protein [Patescibacteria group bacterium]